MFKGIKKSKLTPLEFTIIETIFNFKGLSGYDLILNLNKQFAGTWEAQSGTIYPILSKLERDGFLRSNMVKTQIGPLRKVYFLTEVGEEIIKLKVNKNFHDQLKFLENFLVELSSIYIKSTPPSERKKQMKLLEETLKETFESVMARIPSILEYKDICDQCGAIIDRKVAFCPIVGLD